MKLQQLYSYTRRAIDTWQMIDEGDKIAIGVSGGKDSLTMLYALKGLQRFYPKHFELEAITVDLGLGNFNMDAVKSLCNELNIPYTIYHCIHRNRPDYLRPTSRKEPLFAMCQNAQGCAEQ